MPEITPTESKSVTTLLKNLMPVLHAEIWQWRSSPATALNQIAICLDIATKPQLPREEAERKAIAYMRESRDRIFKYSRRAPFQAPGDEDFGNVQGAFLTADLALLQGLGQWISPDSPANVGEQLESSAPGGKALCMWFGMTACRNKQCRLSHGPCPFCHGVKCGNQAGYLAFHLSDLKQPRQIVLTSSLGATSDGKNRGSASAGKDAGRAGNGNQGADNHQPAKRQRTDDWRNPLRKW